MVSLLTGKHTIFQGTIDENTSVADRGWITLNVAGAEDIVFVSEITNLTGTLSVTVTVETAPDSGKVGATTIATMSAQTANGVEVDDPASTDFVYRHLQASVAGLASVGAGESFDLHVYMYYKPTP
jgi:hypothetical protein